MQNENLYAIMDEIINSELDIEDISYEQQGENPKSCILTLTSGVSLQVKLNPNY